MKISKRGLKLNKNKCQIGVKSIVFLGHIISFEGLKVDPAKNEAITKIPLPNSVHELQRLLGMITHSGNFISKFAEVSSTLRTLLKKEVEFKLETPQLDAIRKLKSLATSTQCRKILIYKPIRKLMQTLIN